MSADLKILIVEDSGLNRSLFKKMISTLGYDFASAENGEIALQILEREKIDLILMDIEMPVLDGKTATFKIRNEFSKPVSEIPIIALTAHKLNDLREELKKLGFNDCLVKPFKKDVLANLILKYLYQKNEVYTEDKPIKENALFSLEYLNDMSGGDEAFVKHMVQTFITIVEPTIEKLRLLSREKNFEFLHMESHRFVSQISFIGASSTALICKEIEEYSQKKTHLAKISGLIDELEVNCLQICNELKSKV